jgi:hypothetical protein
MQYSGAGGKLIHQKKPEAKKSRDTVPLNNIFAEIRRPNELVDTVNNKGL